MIPLEITEIDMHKVKLLQFNIYRNYKKLFVISYF